MSEIRKLTDNDLKAAAYIVAEAYPSMKAVSTEEQAKLQKRLLKLHREEPTASFYGLFREGALLGVMVLYDFDMNFLGARVPTGGVGQIAVALPHKKERVCKEMILFFLRRYRRREFPLTALYPFRPDFYHKMGYGYGPKMDQYRLKPSAFPKRATKTHVRYLTRDDKQKLADCYNRVADRTHGMMRKTERELERLFSKPEHRLVGCELDGKLWGYLIYTWEQGESFILNDLHVKEFIYENREALSELATYLHIQADQVRYVIVNTQDEFFHFLLTDPRNNSDRLIPDVYHETNAQGVGLMYRIVDVAGIFGLLAEQNFNGQTCTLKLTIHDSLLPENAGSTLLHFEGGYAQILEGGGHDVEVSLDIAEFSSLLVGTVDLGSLYRYGLADISEPAWLETINHLFAVEQKPRCTTSF